MDNEKVIELFKLAFGEEEYQKLVEAAMDEAMQELVKKSANKE